MAEAYFQHWKTPRAAQRAHQQLLTFKNHKLNDKLHYNPQPNK
jgi:hypothetical protein